MLSEENGVGYFKCLDAVFTLPICSSAKLVLIYLCRRANSEGGSFPSFTTIGRDCSCSARTAQRALVELTKHGLVAVTSRRREGKSNLYTLAAHLRPPRRKVEEVGHNDAPPTSNCRTPPRQIVALRKTHKKETTHLKEAEEVLSFSAERQAVARQKTDQEAAAIAAKGGRWQGVATVIAERRRSGVTEDCLRNALSRLCELGESAKSPVGFLKKILDEALVDHQAELARRKRQDEKELAFKADRAEAARARNVCLDKFGGVDLKLMVENARRGRAVELVAKDTRMEEVA